MYLHDWAKGSGNYHGEELAGLMADFEIDDAALEGVRILLASYTYEDYSGDAFVLFERGGKLFEVNGGHCSCYGLEGQWEPEEVTREALIHRIESGNLGRDYSYESGTFDRNVFADELLAVLAAYERAS